jgi:hypothetical protein
MKYCKVPEIEAQVVQLVRSGWHFCRGGKHGKLRTPQGTCTLTVPVTPPAIAVHGSTSGATFAMHCK